MVIEFGNWQLRPVDARNWQLWHYREGEYTGGVKIYTDATITPEQAIAATLGETPTPPPPTPPKQPPYDLLIDLLRDEWGIDVSWDGLRRFWYVGLNEKGMRMRDERDATLGRGTCKVEYVSDWMGWHCKACDVLWQGLRDQRPRFCPNCGAEVVELERENEKLRELVRDVMPIVCDGCHERLCEMPKEEHPFVTCSFADRMRELGIEVGA